MKLKEIIVNIDTSKKNKWYNFEPICDELNIPYVDVDDYKVPLRLQAYPITQWLCTDTHVGIEAHFLDDEFVFLTKQMARRSYVEIIFKDQQSLDKVKSYVYSLLIQEPDDNIQFMEQGDLDAEWGEGFELSFSGQLLAKEVILKETGERAEVIDKFPKDPISEDLIVKSKDGSKHQVKISDVLVPFSNLK